MSTFNENTALEAKIQAAGAVAERVTPDQVEALMKRVTCVVVQRPADTTSTFAHAFLDSKFFLASGHSACVSEANFNAEIGEDVARRKALAAAREKLWELEGYALYCRQRNTPVSIDLVAHRDGIIKITGAVEISGDLVAASAPLQ